MSRSAAAAASGESAASCAASASRSGGMQQVLHSSMARSRRSCSGICRRAAPLGIDVTIEDFGLPGSPNGTIAGCAAILDRVPALRFAFDTGNFSCYGEDPHAAYERLRGRISFVHLKDRPAGPDGVDPQVEAPTGDGALDLGRLVRRMIADGYAGAFAVEHFGHPDQESAMRRSAAFCRRLLGGS